MSLYTKEFAESIWLPFLSGPYRACIADVHSTINDLLADPRSFETASGGKFTETEVGNLWGMITAQKRRVQAFYLARTTSLSFFAAQDLAQEQIG
jgi:hypothetical protein